MHIDSPKSGALVGSLEKNAARVCIRHAIKKSSRLIEESIKKFEKKSTTIKAEYYILECNLILLATLSFDDA